MKTAKQDKVTLGILNAVIEIEAEVNEKDEDQYNQLRFIFSQQTNSAFSQEIRIYSVSKQEVLELADKIKKLAKYFPSE